MTKALEIIIEESPTSYKTPLVLNGVLFKESHALYILCFKTVSCALREFRQHSVVNTMTVMTFMILYFMMSHARPQCPVPWIKDRSEVVLHLYLAFDLFTMAWKSS